LIVVGNGERRLLHIVPVRVQIDGPPARLDVHCLVAGIWVFLQLQDAGLVRLTDKPVRAGVEVVLVNAIQCDYEVGPGFII